MPDHSVCSHFGTCGGCTLQNMEVAAYRAHKQAHVEALLGRHGLSVPVRPTLFVPAATRRRIALAALHRKKGPVLGFHAAKSHEVVDVQECLISRPELVAMLPLLRSAMAGWLKKAEALDLTVTLYPNGVDVLLTGPEPDIDARQDMAAFGHAHSIARISWRKDVKMVAEPMLALRDPFLKFGAATVVPPAGAFLQPSVEGEAALLQFVCEALDSAPAARGNKPRKIADLFAGCGTFGLRLAEQADVVLVEGDREAVATLTRATTPLKGAKVYRRDLFRDALPPAELNDFDAVVFDPPRAGAKEQTQELAQSRVPLLVAVSCNPDTFARDAKALLAGGYICEWVQPVDQFIWSEHVELVAKFVRSE